MIALGSSLRTNNEWQGSTAWHYTMANIIVLINSTAIYTITVEKREKKICARYINNKIKKIKKKKKEKKSSKNILQYSVQNK